MDLPDEMRIEFSRKRLLLLIAGGGVFVVLGLWALMLDDARIRAGVHFQEPMVVHGLGMAALVVSVPCVLFLAKRLVDGRPALEINRESLTDHSRFGPPRVVAWADVTRVAVVFPDFGTALMRRHSQACVAIHVVDPEKYVAIGGLVGRRINRINLNTCGTPITLIAGALDLSLEQLAAILTAYAGKYGGGAAVHG